MLSRIISLGLGLILAVDEVLGKRTFAAVLTVTLCKTADDNQVVLVCTEVS